MIRNLLQVAFVAGVVMVIYLSLFSAEFVPVELSTWDKANHAAAYAALAFVGGLSIQHRRPLLLIAVALLILGGGLEVAQAALPHRTSSPYDALANAVGISIGILASICISTVGRRRAMRLGPANNP